MNKETGEIREHDKIPAEEKKMWSEPFKVGDVVSLFGVNLKISRVKPIAGKIILVHTLEEVSK